MKKSHCPDIQHFPLSGWVGRPVMSRDPESETKWNEAGEAEALMNNLNWIKGSLEEFCPSVLHSVTLGVLSIVVRRGDIFLIYILSRFFLVESTKGGQMMMMMMILHFCLLSCWLALPVQGKDWFHWSLTTQKMFERQVRSGRPSVHYRLLSLLCQTAKHNQSEGHKFWSNRPEADKLRVLFNYVLLIFQQWCSPFPTNCEVS